jgi:D-alanyl-D-alanine carboxypeptidase
MASTTKIMTGLLALELGHLTDRITVPGSAFNFESDATVMGLHPGQVVTLQDLLYGLMLPSGADAANTIAIHYGGSEAHFVALMNNQASKLGMKDTHYVNAHGLTAHDHYSSAYDLAILARYVATSVPELMKVAATKTYRWNGHVLTNVNHVLFWYPGVDGIKPGYTYEAGICQVLDARRHGRDIVVTLLNTPDLVVDARNLLNFGLRDFTWVKSPLQGDSPSTVQSGSNDSGSWIYFPASGHYVRGKFWNGYLANGGLSALGFPRTEPLWEAQRQVQYFQNGALALNPKTGRVSRLALGLTPLPTRSPTSTPRPTLTPARPTATPREGTVVVSPTVSLTPTPKPHPNTPTPTPRPPSPTPTPTPSLPHPQATAPEFVSFARSHAKFLGPAVGRLHHRNGYDLQVFAYGALLYDPKSHAIYLLPVGDRSLGAHQFLPAYPGNTYPSGFAPSWLLKAIGWAPYLKDRA